VWLSIRDSDNAVVHNLNSSIEPVKYGCIPPIFSSEPLFHEVEPVDNNKLDEPSFLILPLNPSFI